MNKTLRLSLLGSPLVQLGDELVAGLSPQKVKALLIYLAYTAQPQPRELLADLFFDDRPPKQAAANLRAMVSRLRRRLGPFIVAGRGIVSFDTSADFWLDTAVFTPILQTVQQELAHDGSLTPETAVQLTNALELYRGEFLAGFHVREARNFGEWLLLERERWYQQITASLQALIDFHLHWRNYAAGITQARRLIRLDNLQENAHRQLMLLLARSGDRNAALAQYESCRQTLAQALGVEPVAETTALYERIRAAKTAVCHNLPPQFTPFVGRIAELAQISQRLDDPNCRLLTLVGPGGIGKTRLALETAVAHHETFLNGVYFVPLAPVNVPEALVATIADALHFSFYSKESPQSQLINYLREKEILLLLDNFEHLLDSAAFVSDILQQAPHVKILVTSRERLHLRWEWLFDVRGLSYPQDEIDEQNMHYSAIQLFAQSAVRVRPDFSLAAEGANVARLCRLVEGMPLAIELAAAGLRSRLCLEIIDEIEQNLNLLTSSLQDTPERHRSVRAAFAGSWRALSQVEQHTFCKLSLFRGGFCRKAAWQVAGASHSMLEALADKSLLRRSDAGRYAMHELLRQYAAEMFTLFPQEKQEAQTRHSAYYAAYLHQREIALRGKMQKEALAEIGKEIENARAAWQYALAAYSFEVVARLLEGIFCFYDIRSRLHEGMEAFECAVIAMQEVEHEEAGKLLLGRALARQSWFCFRLGLYEPAREHMQKGLATLRNRGEQREEAFAHLVLGSVADEKGEYVEARVLFQKSRTLYQAVDDRWGMAAAFEHLGDVARMVGDYELSRQHYEQSQSLFQAIGDRDRIAGAFNSLGSIAGTMGAYDQAERYFERSLSICCELDDRFGIVSASHNLSNIAYLQGDYVKAKALRQETLSICREIGFRWGVASTVRHLGDVFRRLGEHDEARHLYEEGLRLQREIGHQRDMALTLNSLGSLAQAAGKWAEARAHYRQALKMATAIESLPVALAILNGWGELLAHEGEKVHALVLLTFVLHHPAAEKQTQDAVSRFLDELKPQLSAQIVAAAEEAGKAQTLAKVAARVLD
ncbi:MAG: tetratricopeptide repeat protein [Anaerolineales bacterium]|nr:tetratricopeptide repeat protein [Anaerolineales bacterium]